MAFKSIFFATIALVLTTTSNAATIGVVLDLERGYGSGIMEDHAAGITSPSASTQVLTNDINTMPLSGHDLFVDHLITNTSASTASFDLTVFSDPSDTLFVNEIVSGDVVQFGAELFALGSEYSLTSFTVQAGISGLFTTISASSILGSTGDNLELQFNALDFVGVDTVVLNANLSAVPVPAAVWLFGSGLLGLTGLARRKKA